MNDPIAPMTSATNSNYDRIIESTLGWLLRLTQSKGQEKIRLILYYKLTTEAIVTKSSHAT